MNIDCEFLIILEDIKLIFPVVIIFSESSIISTGKPILSRELYFNGIVKRSLKVLLFIKLIKESPSFTYSLSLVKIFSTTPEKGALTLVLEI